MPFTKILLEKKEGVAKLTLNRPEAMNALDQDVLLELEAALDQIEKDEAVRAVVLTGAGRAFSAGADLKFIQGMRGDARKNAQFLRLFHRVCNRMEALPKPIIAAINGLALAGGLELVQACDLAILSEEARIGDQHANFGLVAGGGGTQRLPRLMGKRKALELLLTGDWLSPQDALQYGLVNKVVPAAKLEEEAMALARKLCQRSPLASATVKALVNRGLQTDLQTGLELEIGAVFQHFHSEDMKEGVQAFVEKRQPVFKGR